MVTKILTPPIKQGQRKTWVYLATSHYKITHISTHMKNEHIHTIISGCVEKGKSTYISGYMSIRLISQHIRQLAQIVNKKLYICQHMKIMQVLFLHDLNNCITAVLMFYPQCTTEWHTYVFQTQQHKMAQTDLFLALWIRTEPYQTISWNLNVQDRKKAQYSSKDISINFVLFSYFQEKQKYSSVFFAQLFNQNI